jgi:hypothetical protein
MLCDIRVTAQYRENYSDTNIPYWKPKGGVELIIPQINDDVVLYAAPDEVDTAIQKLLLDKSNSMCLYELISWELIFSKPEELSSDIFMKHLLNQ